MIQSRVWGSQRAARACEESVAAKRYAEDHTHHVLLQNEQNEYPQDWQVRSLDQPDSSSSKPCGLWTGAWQYESGQWSMLGSLSIALFFRSHLHLPTSSGVTIRATSSSPASLPELTHSGSGHPTLPMSPSWIHDFQKCSKQLLQNMCPQLSWRHRVPL
jgi:hypothetical protein